MNVEDGGNTEIPVVPAQQQTQQIGFLPDRLGRDPEDVTQDELGSGAVTERTGRRLPELAFVQGVEVAPLQRFYDGIAQIREQLSQGERYLPACLQKIVRQCAQLRRRRPHSDDEIRMFASIPTRPMARLVGVAERDAILERHQLEAALRDLLENPLFQQQAVGVRGDRQSRMASGESYRDGVTGRQ